jgi:hypothetical protein
MTDAMPVAQASASDGPLPTDTALPATKTGDDASGPPKEDGQDAKADFLEGDSSEDTQLAKWQWLFSPSDMDLTPSVLHSHLSPEQERYKRWKGVRLIFQIGDYMRLGNHVTCTAITFFHRFYMRKAMPSLDTAGDRPHDTYTFQEMAPTCIYLACKVEEAHRKLHGIVEATMAVLDRTPTGIERAEAHVYRADVNSRDYRRWKDIVLLHEERLLETLCFDMIIDQPHPIAIKACQRMATSRDMAQLTIVVLNSLLYGAVCMFSDAPTLAACAFKKACQYLELDANSWLTDTRYADHNWTEAFDVDEDEVEEAMPSIEEHLAFHHERVAPASSAAQSSVSTPLPAQHVMAVHLPSFSSDDRAQNSSTIAVEGKAPGTAANVGETNASVAPDELASGEVPVSRPVSRHGSKTGGAGPPPPLSIPIEKEAERTQNVGDHQQDIAAKIKHEQGQQEMAVDGVTAVETTMSADSKPANEAKRQECEDDGAL